jgi:hypothetical protein
MKIQQIAHEPCRKIQAGSDQSVNNDGFQANLQTAMYSGKQLLSLQS